MSKNVEVTLPFSTYVALGDSISIDDYPELDHAERTGTRLPGLGAVSLLCRNRDDVWPEFAGRDLAHLAPRARCVDLTYDGATVEGVLGSMEAAGGEGPALVTLTVGGNDLLALIGASRATGERGVARALAGVNAIADRVRARLPASLLLVGTVYDPTDGTGLLEGHRLRAEEMSWLDRFNRGLAAVCAGGDRRLVDIHAHFLGHGVSAPARDRWYWSGSIIEPSAQGASEVRRLWLAAATLER